MIIVPIIIVTRCNFIAENIHDLYILVINYHHRHYTYNYKY